MIAACGISRGLIGVLCFLVKLWRVCGGCCASINSWVGGVVHEELLWYFLVLKVDIDVVSKVGLAVGGGVLLEWEGDLAMWMIKYASYVMISCSEVVIDYYMFFKLIIDNNNDKKRWVIL